MNQLEYLKRAFDYIEEHLEDEIDYGLVAQQALCSQYHFQRMFTFLAGIPLSEYIRRRRLTLAAFELQNGSGKIIDIAVKYGYTSADAFSRAFQSLHHITPSKAREPGVLLKAYPKIAISLILKGATEMNYRIEEKQGFCILGVTERFSIEALGASVGQMWKELPAELYGVFANLADGGWPGLAGAYANMHEDNTTDYYIGAISTGECPDNLTRLEIPAQTWAVFECAGPLPHAMKDTWGRIFSEWFPTTSYEHAPSPEIEWYPAGDMSGSDYKSEIWIPIIRGKK